MANYCLLISFFFLVWLQRNVGLINFFSTLKGPTSASLVRAILFYFIFFDSTLNPVSAHTNRRFKSAKVCKKHEMFNITLDWTTLLQFHYLRTALHYSERRKNRVKCIANMFSLIRESHFKFRFQSFSIENLKSGFCEILFKTSRRPCLCDRRLQMFWWNSFACLYLLISSN